MPALNNGDNAKVQGPKFTPFHIVKSSSKVTIQLCRMVLPGKPSY